MSSPPASSGRFFVVVGGKPEGPHSAADILGLWKSGTLTGQTLACQQGDAAWVMLKDFEPVLQAGEPQLPVVPPSPHQPFTRPAEPVAASTGGFVRFSRLIFFTGALAFFFQPWMELNVLGQRLIQQSGMEAVFNRGDSETAAEQLIGLAGGPKNGDLGPEVGYSFLAGAALGAVAIALLVMAGRNDGLTATKLGVVALACFGIQVAIGFPLKQSIDRQMEKMMDLGGEKQEFPAGNLSGLSGKVEFTPWFYGELALVGAATLLGVYGTVRR